MTLAEEQTTWPPMLHLLATNRMNSAGWEYDLAGNMTRGQNADGVWQRYEYDAAGRLKRVLDDVGNWLSDNNYGSGRQRIFRNEPGGSGITWFVWGGDSVLAEYTSTSWGGTYTWSKSYIYAGSRLLMAAANNGAGGENIEYHHPDRLGTRMVTDPAANTLYLQSTLPFGTQFDSETTGSSNRLFTSYDRSAGTGLDYAVNRTYSSGQGRFTSVDPIGMASVSIGNPQSLNLFAYVRNNPIDLVDPSGLYEGPPCLGGLFNNEKGVWECPSTDLEIGGAGGVGISEQVQIDNPPGTGEGPTDGGGSGGGGGGEEPPAGNSGATESDNSNELLSKCYKIALDAYNVAGNTAAQQTVDSLKLTGLLGAASSTATGVGSSLVSNSPRISGTRVFLRGARVVVQTIQSPTRLLGLVTRAAGIGGLIGSAGVNVLEYSGLGREGFLRDAIRDCNRAHPNATNKVTGLYSPFLSGNIAKAIN